MADRKSGERGGERGLAIDLLFAGAGAHFIMPAGALKHLSEFINATHI